jgi:hypothetical protein
LDVLITDTPFLDEGIRARIEDVRLLDERLSRCDLLADYLDEHWAALDGRGSGFDWPAHSQALRREIDSLKTARKGARRDRGAI